MLGDAKTFFFFRILVGSTKPIFQTLWRSSDVHNRTLGRRAADVVVHDDIRDLENAVSRRWAYTEPRVPIAPVVPDPLTRGAGHVGGEHGCLDPVDEKGRLARQPVDPVLVLGCLRVGGG